MAKTWERTSTQSMCRALNTVFYVGIIAGTCYAAFYLLLIWTQEFHATGSVKPLLP